MDSAKRGDRHGRPVGGPQPFHDAMGPDSIVGKRSKHRLQDDQREGRNGRDYCFVPRTLEFAALSHPVICENIATTSPLLAFGWVTSGGKTYMARSKNVADLGAIANDYHASR